MPQDQPLPLQPVIIAALVLIKQWHPLTSISSIQRTHSEFTNSLRVASTDFQFLNIRLLHNKRADFFEMPKEHSSDVVWLIVSHVLILQEARYNASEWAQAFLKQNTHLANHGDIIICSMSDIHLLVIDINCVYLRFCVWVCFQWAVPLYTTTSTDQGPTPSFPHELEKIRE